MMEWIPFLFTTIAGICVIRFRKRLTQSTVRWQQKVCDVTYGARGVKILERWHIVIGAFFLVLSLLHLLTRLQ